MRVRSAAVELNAQVLNRTTMRRQLLDRRVGITAIDATSRVVALQSQNPMSPYIALWNRMSSFDPTEVDEALALGRLIKATTMRITLHTMTAPDHSMFRAAMMPSLRAAGFYDRRFKELAMTIEEADELIPGLSDFASTPRTRVEIEAHLSEVLGEQSPAGLWRALRFSAPWRYAPGDHPWGFGEPAQFITIDHEPPDHREALAHLVRGYLRAFGPATVSDIAQFTLLTSKPIRSAIDRLADEVIWHGDQRSGMVDVADAEVSEGDVALSPRLLGMWDNVLLAYADRSRVIPEDLRKVVIRRNGDVLPTVLVDGYVAGVWRPTEEGIEVTALRDWPSKVWGELEPEAIALWDLVSSRDPWAYRRHYRWWDDLQDTTTKTFG